MPCFGSWESCHTFRTKTFSFPVLPGPRLHYGDLLRHGGQLLTFIRPWGITKLHPPCPPLSPLRWEERERHLLLGKPPLPGCCCMAHCFVMRSIHFRIGMSGLVTWPSTNHTREGQLSRAVPLRGLPLVKV